jgi:hypothetical protein
MESWLPGTDTVSPQTKGKEKSATKGAWQVRVRQAPPCARNRPARKIISLPSFQSYKFCSIHTAHEKMLYL